jgi:hypoxanthine phosphoribosyltransferase
MNKILLKDKEFDLFITETRLLKEISRIASEIQTDMENANPLFVGVLNGSFMFVAALMRELNSPDELIFARYSSYQGSSSSGNLKEIMPITEDIRGRHIVLLEDIVDTGTTMHFLRNKLKDEGAADVRVATLLYKPAALLYADAAPEYVGMEIPNDFIVGFGLDYDGYGRALRDIYRISNK